MIDRFDVEYYIDGENPTEPVIAINPPTVMTIIPNLMKGTTYGVRVRAVNSAGPSDYSTPVTARTDIDRKSLYLSVSLCFSLCFSLSISPFMSVCLSLYIVLQSYHPRNHSLICVVSKVVNFTS